MHLNKSIILTLATVIILIGITVYHAINDRKINDVVVKNIEPVVEVKLSSASVTPEFVEAPKEFVELIESHSDSLGEIKLLLLEIDKRMTQLEQDVNGIRVDQRAIVDQSSALTSDQEQVNSDAIIGLLKNDVESVQQQLKREQYLLSIDHKITAELNPIVSDDVFARYDKLFKTRQEWADKVSVDSSECGGTYCKVIVSYPNDLDPVSDFELDASILMPTAKDYPISKATYTIKPGGNKQVTLYLAAKGTDFPVQ